MLMRLSTGTGLAAGGSVRLTDPEATVLLVSWIGGLKLVKPCCSRAWVAWSKLRPFTSGTATGAGPDDTMIVTVEPTSAFVPGFGMLVKTVPLGAAFG